MQIQYYKCELCKVVRQKVLSDAERLEAYMQTHPNAFAAGKATSLICEYCYKIYLEWVKEEGIEL